MDTIVSTPYNLSPVSFDVPYEFPRDLLPNVMKGSLISCYIKKSIHQYITILDESKIPLVLIACGSFSPITYLHLRMFGNKLDVCIVFSLTLKSCRNGTRSF